jgi:predicted DNA-binding transcriptional regulator AlpA
MKASMFLALKYDRLLLRLDEVCAEMGMAVQTARNQMSAGTFPIPTRKEGKYVLADVRDVGQYIDDCRDQARREWELVRKQSGTWQGQPSSLTTPDTEPEPNWAIMETFTRRQPRKPSQSPKANTSKKSAKR